MTQDGFTTFEKTLNESYGWLVDISSAMEDPRRRIAYHALRGVLFAIRDRLPVNEALDLAAQLPILIRGIYFDGYHVTGKPDKFHRDEMVRRVQDELQTVGGANVLKAIHAVSATMNQHVSAGEMVQVRNALPEDIRSLLHNPQMV